MQSFSSVCVENMDTKIYTLLSDIVMNSILIFALKLGCGVTLASYNHPNCENNLHPSAASCDDITRLQCFKANTSCVRLEAEVLVETVDNSQSVVFNTTDCELSTVSTRTSDI
jgi:hypothetical protein